MPVPVVTGLPQISQPLDNEKIIEENGASNDSTEDEEQMKSQDDCLEKGQDCLMQTEEDDLLDLENDFEDITLKVHADAGIEQAIAPTIETKTANGSPNGFVEISAGLLDNSCGNGNSMVTTLRAVEPVPCTSYSSSDDDDDDDDDESEFFDANEYTDNDLQSEEAKRYISI